MRDGLGRRQTLLVLGGSSEIGLATARVLVDDGVRSVVLAGRGRRARDREVEELRAAGATVTELPFDANDTAAHELAIGAAFEQLGDIDVALIAFGTLGEPARDLGDHGAALDVIRTNTTGAISALVVLGERFRAQGHGTIVLLSSAGAERVRKTNVVYSASKAGADAFAQGLGDALAGSGVRVMIVRPGFVRGHMTHGFPEPPVVTTPHAVACAIRAGLRRDAEIVWVPRRMRPVMSVLRHLPRAVFRRLEM